MRTFEMTTERMKIGDLEEGMKLMETLYCAKPNCKKHATTRVIDPDLREGKELTEFDIIKINREYECLYSSGFKTFGCKKDIMEFLEGRSKSRTAVYTVILVDKDFMELRTETVASIFQIAKEMEKKTDLKIKIAAEQEYLFTIQKPTEKNREFRGFLKKLRTQIKKVYNEVESGSRENEKPLPPELISDTYETIRTSRAMFEKMANSSMMRELQNDYRESIYEGIHNHIYNVALTSAKIVYNMKFGNKAHMEQVFSACVFLDIGIPLAKKTNAPMENHPVLSAKTFELYLNKLEEISLAYNVAKTPEAVPVIPIDNTTMMNLKMGKTIIEYHHERMDGSGYPYKLREHQRTQEIDRLVAIVDEFFRLTGTVDYHTDPPVPITPMTRSSALHVLEKKAREGIFDQRLLDVFKQNVYAYPLYSFVLLDGRKRAMVTRLNPNLMDRPVVYSMDSHKEIDLAHPEYLWVTIQPDNENVPQHAKDKIAVNIMIKKKKNTIKIDLDEGYVCPRCKNPLGDHLPDEITQEFPLSECLLERKSLQVCPQGHFCLIYIEPPEDCNLLKCKQGENCSADWDVNIEAF